MFAIFSLFSAMSRRRVACPQITQHLWDAIKVIRIQRQIPNMTRITRYMSRVHGAKEGENAQCCIWNAGVCYYQFY